MSQRAFAAAIEEAGEFARYEGSVRIGDSRYLRFRKSSRGDILEIPVRVRR